MNMLYGVRAGYGLAQLAVPNVVLRAFRLTPDRPTVLVCRALGARELAQAAVSTAAPTPAVLAVGVTVDVTHALSMIGVATFSRRHRRAALTSAALASTFAALGVAARSRRLDDARRSGRRGSVRFGNRSSHH
jgi:hypothetical protein